MKTELNHSRQNNSRKQIGLNHAQNQIELIHIYGFLRNNTGSGSSSNSGSTSFLLLDLHHHVVILQVVHQLN